MKGFAAIVLALVFASYAYTAGHSSAYSSAEEKFTRITSVSEEEKPATAEPIVLSDAELAAYLNEGGVALPEGVEQVRFANKPGVVTATAHVDFDKLTAGRRSRSMWMMLFKGTHDVTAVADAKATNGTGEVHVQSMELDGVEVPRPALEFLVERFIKPKYGDNVGLDSEFKMPARIDTAVVGSGKVTLTQK